MSESKKTFQIDPEQKRDGYRSYDAFLLWGSDQIERVTSEPEDDSILIKSNGIKARVFAATGPKAVVIPDVDRMDEIEDASLAMKFDDYYELDERTGKIMDRVVEEFLKLDPNLIEEFYCGRKKVTLTFPVDSLPPIDFAQKNFNKLGERQRDGYQKRKAWPKSLFKYRLPGLLKEKLFKPPFLEKFRSVREKKVGVAWASQVFLRGEKFNFDGDKVHMELSMQKPEPRISKKILFKEGGVYVFDIPADLTEHDLAEHTSVLNDLTRAYGINNQVCPVEIRGDGNMRAKMFFAEISRLKDGNTEESIRQALNLQSISWSYLPKYERREKTEPISSEKTADWIIEGENVEQKLKMTEVTFSTLRKSGTELLRKIEKDGMTFLIKSLNERGEVLECLFYVIKDGVLYPRVAYKSRSHKRWRVDTFNQGTDRGKGEYSYTAETIPFLELNDAFEDLERNRQISDDIVDRDRLLKDKSIHTYASEVERDMPVLYDFASFTTNNFGGNLKEVDDVLNPDYIPDDFIPDFSVEPIAVRRRKDGDLDVEIEHYHHCFRGIELDFHIAHDSDGRVWIDRLERTLKEGYLTTYGTLKKSLEFGPLSLKPFDYKQNIPALNPSDESLVTSKFGNELHVIKRNPEKPIQAIHDKNSDYADITPYLDQLKLIQRYREQRCIFRK